MKINVGLGTCGISAGGRAVYSVLEEEIARKNLDVSLQVTGCMGMCYDEVLVELFDGNESYLYGKVTPDMALEIINRHVIAGEPIPEWVVRGKVVKERDPFFDKQDRIVLRNCGIINPESIEDYMERQGYEGIRKVTRDHTPEEVIDMVLQSGLRGRGGGGFPTGLKW
ncbi:MAG: NADH-quinone oxidoreductase subunit F, partial [Candidatus Neomarinimicrobiota bacterium]